MILCICPSPAIDVTYHVDTLHHGGSTRVRSLSRRAGDALVAGLARGLAGGHTAPELLTEAVAVSAAAVLHPFAGRLDPAEYAAQRAGLTVRALQDQS